MNSGVKEYVFWIFGYGRFGRIAFSRLAAGYPRASFTVVDSRAAALDEILKLPVRAVQADAAGFLAGSLTPENAPDFIIPAVPVHLAYEWLKKKDPISGAIRIPVPDRAALRLPNAFPAETGRLYASYATFVCPDDCPEPPDICTVTGEDRPGALYRDFQQLEIEGFISLCVRSRQLAPGVGGYGPEALWRALETVKRAGAEKDYLISTACLCHGVMDAFRLGPEKQ